MGIDIQGKTVLVTGANRGIGKAILEACLEHGANRVYAAVRQESSVVELHERFGDRVVPRALDLTDNATIINAASLSPDVEVVINNGGLLRTAAPLDENFIQTFQEELETNMFGLVRMAQAFAPILSKNGGGAFVQINSVASLKTFHDFTSYCASKAASYSYTQGLRESFAKQNTHVLSVHPGPIATDMARSVGMEGEPPSVVGEGIVQALKRGDFLLFPDSIAHEMGAVYEVFAKQVVLGE